MTNNFNMIVGSGAALVATLALAAPAQAQYYPQQPYPQQPYGYPQQGYPQQQGGVVGAIIDSVTGYGRYPQGNYGYERVNQRSAISQCAAATEQRLGGGYRGQGYQNGYRQGGGRVLGITNVEQRGNGSLRVTGVATSGRGYSYGNQGYGNAYGQGAYGAQAQADLRFTCRVNLRGQVSDVKISRNGNGAYRGY